MAGKKSSEQVFEIESESKYLKPLRDSVSRLLDKAGFDGKTRESILIALGEACTNAMRHSYQCETGKPIRVTYEEAGDRITLKIRDYGCKIDPCKIDCTPKLPPETGGGLGIYFMKTMMDEVKYNTAHPTGNELVLMKLKPKGDQSENRIAKK